MSSASSKKSSERHGGWTGTTVGTPRSIATKARIIEVPMTDEDIKDVWGPLARGAVGLATLGISELLWFGGQNYTHDALEFDITLENGGFTTLTINFAKNGATPSWGKFTTNRTVTHEHSTNIYVEHILNNYTPRLHYDLGFYNCKNYSAEKFKFFTGVDPNGFRDHSKAPGGYVEDGAKGGEVDLTAGRVSGSEGAFRMSAEGPGVKLQAGEYGDQEAGFVIDPKILHAEVSYRGVNLETGISAKTGAAIRKDGASFHLLGFGFSLGNGAGISTPLGGISFGLKSK